MVKKSATPRRVIAVVAAIAAGGLLGVTPAAHAADGDGDGIPSRWERNHGMDPRNAADARADFDRDGLRNLGEYRLGGALRDEDTDDDGYDDGDEAHDGLGSTDLDDEDGDDDGTVDGDEDADRDGIDNEDEDDGSERCRYDDDDSDDDDVNDEDENELGGDVDDSDSDDDGTEDGDEDGDQDGDANEDEDDSDTDVCSPDEDGDGEADEDESDLLGVIDSFDGTTLVVTTVNGFTVSGQVTEDTEVEFEDSGEDESEGDEDGDATTADLQPGVQVAELEFDDETGAIEEIEIYSVPVQP